MTNFSVGQQGAGENTVVFWPARTRDEKWWWISVCEVRGGLEGGEVKLWFVLKWWLYRVGQALPFKETVGKGRASEERESSPITSVKIISCLSDNSLCRQTWEFVWVFGYSGCVFVCLSANSIDVILWISVTAVRANTHKQTQKHSLSEH